MMQAFICGVAVCGPGLDGWAEGRAILAGERAYEPRPIQPSVPSILAPNERRRTGAAVRLALSVAQQASEMAGIAPGAIPSLFATSNSDGAVMHAILQTLARDEPVSPTQFHNSVHNAASGYWSIATGSRQPTSCLSGHDATAAAALLKAVAAGQVEQSPILLCVYEVPMPEPLASRRPTVGSFGAALVLAPRAGAGALARLSLAYRAGAATMAQEAPRGAAWRELAAGNPAARLLRLLETLALGVADVFALRLLDGQLEITVDPC
ncbi:MAG TPA: beta-ketoacyl synthase chain length factor [Acetobacteraceae bacterium]|nr:beta-ketoacyl synthase chain length factor [Acetobacteraceae bacterium]